MQEVSDRRKIRALYKPPPEQDNSKNYCLLVTVILISMVFIAGEVIGGTIAGSIAIISDAIHLVSDLVGFIFTFVFLYLSKKVMNERVSFGYHRMQLLGALANLFIVWILVFYIVYQATVRLFNQSFVKHPAIMLITAGAGLMINIVMYMILHNGSGHSHGLLAEECDHDHEHEHDHHHHVSPLKYQKNKNEMECSDICQDLICKQTVIEAHCHRGHNKSIYIHKLSRKHSEQDVAHAHHEKCDHKYECESEPGKPQCEQQHQHLSTCFENKKKQKTSHVHHQEQCHSHHQDHVHHKEECHSHSEQSHGSPKHQDHDHSHHHPHSHHDGIDISHESHESHESHKQHDHNNEVKHVKKQNISMKAATLHALSDTVQSVGVLIAALVIYFFGSNSGAEVTEWNAWHLFDPISTYIFSVLSLVSTYPIIKNCYYLIMESTPDEIDLDELRGEFENIYGVVDVHDIHVWDLKPGKTIIIGHVLTMAGTQRAVLTQLTDMCRQKRIYHSTFQVEEQDFKDDEEYILCHHDIH